MISFAWLDTLAQQHTTLSAIIKQDLFFVGGCVRDTLLGLTQDPKDIDITCAGDPVKIYENIDKTNYSHFKTEKFGTMTLIPKEDKNYNFEITPFRLEASYDDHRHPNDIERTNDLIGDAQRRDFTINCLYYSYLDDKKLASILAKKESKVLAGNERITPLDKNGIIYLADTHTLIIQNPEYISNVVKNGSFDDAVLLAYTDMITVGYTIGQKVKQKWSWLHIILDPYKWIQDTVARKLRAVGIADKRFYEDALRIMRAVRIVNVLNHKLLNRDIEQKTTTFDFATDTWISLKKNYYLIQRVAKERIKDEICKVFQSGNPFGFIALIDELNILKWIFPALYELKWLDQPVRYHPFDVYNHTLLAVKSLQEINDDYLTRLGMLYHDVGKKDQYYMHTVPLDREEVRKIFGTWLNHHTSGVDLVKKDFWALWFSKKEIETIAWYVANHSKPGEILFANEGKREKKMRNMLSDVWYEKVNNILDITIGDRLGQMNPLQNSSDISDVQLLKDILENLNTQEGQFTMKDLQIDGKTLMKELSLESWPILWDLLDKAFIWVRDDIKIRNTKEKILTYIKENTEK